MNLTRRPDGPPPLAGPLVLAVMDGVGLSPPAPNGSPAGSGDAVLAARAPFIQGLSQQPLGGRLQAHGRAVGLASDEDMGNSEVGHNALGAGRVVAQGASRVAEAVASGSLFRSDTWLALCAHLRASGGVLHLLGLLSDGNVHSHIDHALALLAAAEAANLPTCRLHVLLDGRDVIRDSALDYLDRLEQALAGINARPGRDYAIASGGGRMHLTMDRYGADWPMVARGWRCHVHGQAPKFASARAAVLAARAERPGHGDQDLPGFVVARPDGTALGPMLDGDACVLWNFRGDRMLELVAAFEDEAFSGFARGRRPAVWLAGMTQYDGDAKRPARYLVAPPAIANTLGEALAGAGVRQLALSETQKFGHVTYFFNGNKMGAFRPEVEDYVEVPSAPLPFAEQPAMQAAAIASRAAELLHARPYGFARLNFPNGDMVGHTGDFAATTRAIEAVEQALVALCRTVVAELRGGLIVTADHGNAEDMFERDARGNVRLDARGQPRQKTSHSLNPVPFAAILPAPLCASYAPRAGLAQGAFGLANVAATCALLLGFEPLAPWAPALLVPRPQPR